LIVFKLITILLALRTGSLLRINLIIIILLILLCISINIYSIGEKESGLIIPSDSSIIFKIEIEEILNSNLGHKLLDLLFYTPPEINKTIEGKQLLELYLKNRWCIDLDNLKRIYIFTSSLNLYSLNYEIGAIIELIATNPEVVINCIKKEIKLTGSVYKNQTYYFGEENGEVFYISYQKTGFLISNNKPGMEKMLNVVSGNDDISKNENLFKLVRLYSNNMIYGAGYLKQNSHIFFPPPFNAITKFGLAIEINNSINANLTAFTENSNKAEEIIEILNGYINFFIMIVEARSKEAGKIVRSFYDSMDIKISGASVLLEVELSKNDIDKVLLLIPIIENMNNQ